MERLKPRSKHREFTSIESKLYRCHSLPTITTVLPMSSALADTDEENRVIPNLIIPRSKPAKKHNRLANKSWRRTAQIKTEVRKVAIELENQSVSFNFDDVVF